MGCLNCCLSSCYGVGCGYCSECVGAAACNPELCGGCLTGTCQPQTENLAPGSDVGLCGNPCITPCLIPNSNIPIDSVNQAGPTCCCGYQPCSPTQCGTTCQPPCVNSCHQCASGRGGGSGAGSAGSAGGGKSGAGSASQQTSKLSQAMSRLGATMASLLNGGQRLPITAQTGNKVPSQPLSISSNTFLLVLLIGGAFLLFFAFGHKPEGD